MKLLKIIFEKFEEQLYKPNDRYKKLTRECVEISDKLEKTFTNEQRELFYKLDEKRNEIAGNENEQFFYFGYIICKELDIETKIKKE
jgi:hypothetical protein